MILIYIFHVRTMFEELKAYALKKPNFLNMHPVELEMFFIEYILSIWSLSCANTLLGWIKEKRADSYTAQNNLKKEGAIKKGVNSTYIGLETTSYRELNTCVVSLRSISKVALCMHYFRADHGVLNRRPTNVGSVSC